MVECAIELFCQIGKIAFTEMLLQSIVRVPTPDLAIFDDLGDSFFESSVVSFLGCLCKSADCDIEVTNCSEFVRKNL